MAAMAAFKFLQLCCDAREGELAFGLTHGHISAAAHGVWRLSTHLHRHAVLDALAFHSCAGHCGLTRAFFCAWCKAGRAHQPISLGFPAWHTDCVRGAAVRGTALAAGADLHLRVAETGQAATVPRSPTALGEAVRLAFRRHRLRQGRDAPVLGRVTGVRGSRAAVSVCVGTGVTYQGVPIPGSSSSVSVSSHSSFFFFARLL